jgi:hypothetical protein
VGGRGIASFSAGYRLNALVWTGLWVVLLLLSALRPLIGVGRELPGQFSRDEYVERHERRTLGRGWVVAGVAIAALAIGITLVEVIRLSV